MNKLINSVIKILKGLWQKMEQRHSTTRANMLDEDAKAYIRIKDDKLIIGSVAVFTIGDKSIEGQYVLCPSDAYKFLERVRGNYISKYNQKQDLD